MKFNNKYNDILSLHRPNSNSNNLNKQLTDTFNLIKSNLDNSKIKNVLDIGCGLGLINIFIYNHFKCNLYLLDKSIIEENKRFIGFGDINSMGFYGNLNAAKELLILNDIPDNYINLIEPEQFNLIKNKLDLVISLLSWCHHYPYNTYSELVYKKLNKNGIIIVDCRPQEYKNLINDNRYNWEIIKKKRPHSGFIMSGKKI